MRPHTPKLSAVICPASSKHEAADEFRRLRKHLFIDILGWPLQHRDDREVDAFDVDPAIYAVLRIDGRCVGGWRAIRCDRPYLAASVFPGLASDAVYPVNRRFIEISRFCVQRSVHVPGTVTSACYGTMLRYALDRRAEALVAVADLAHERLLRHFGIATRRYGRPAVVGHDRNGREILAVAGEIPLGDQNRKAVDRLVKLTDGVEIYDETLVFGSERLSS